MDDRTYLGSLAEAKVIATLTEQKWFVFNQTSGKAPFDVVAYRDGILKRISIKGTSNKDEYDSYLVQIGRVRSNKTSNTVHKFDSNECDVVAIYIKPLDKVCFISAQDITSGRAISLREVASTSSNKPSRVIDEYKIMEG